MQTDAVRPKLFNIRFSEEEWARVERLASHYGVNAAALFRMLLKREDDVVQERAAMRAAPTAQAKANVEIKRLQEQITKRR